MKFGQAASDYVPSENGGDVWIRRFKDPATQIRICPAQMQNERGKTVYGTDAWPTEREHYAEGVGSFPCAERFGIKCVGCEDDDPKVQEKRRQYYINAIDEKGALRVFKLGVMLYKVFQAREKRALAADSSNKQPLSDRDYTILRMGKDLETRYDPEPQEKYDVEWPKQLHDIDAILTDLYAHADEAYNGPPVDASDEELKETKPAAVKRAAKQVAKEEVIPVADDEPKKGWGTNPTDDQIDSADTEMIKHWLDEQEVEYPSRAPRSRLITMAKAKAAEPPY